ncbi:MAG: hypothetical protein ACUVX9_04140 [Anaerolineae bacterium]
MVDPRDDWSSATDSPDETGGADALYHQGMRCYRLRHWRDARAHFAALKQLHPHWPDIDALLAEVDMFIRLESLDVRTPPADEPNPHRELSSKAQRSRRARRLWLPHILVAVAAICAAGAVATSGATQPRPQDRVAALRHVGYESMASGQWNRAIDAFEGLLVLAPKDSEARDALWHAYYERGEQWSAAAETLEGRGLYSQAAEMWERAAADFAAAHQVSPEHTTDGRGATQERANLAGLKRVWAMQMGAGLALRQEAHWEQAYGTLLALRQEAPAYHSAEVQAALAEAALQRGRELLAEAGSVAGVEAALVWVRQAASLLPGDTRLQAELAHAVLYQEAWSSARLQEWDRTVRALVGLLGQEPGYAAGGACRLLSRAYMERAQALRKRNLLTMALADYRSAQELACGDQAQIRAEMSLVMTALTPTATLPAPTAMPVSPTGTPALLALE